MRQFAPVLIASVVVAYTQFAAAQDSDRTSHTTGAKPTVGAVAEGSDAHLLAERHLALYRASKYMHDNGSSSSAAGPVNHDPDAPPVIVRTSATAALPITPRDSVNRPAEN